MPQLESHTLHILFSVFATQCKSDTVYDNIVTLRLIKVPVDVVGVCSHWSRSESRVGCLGPWLGRGLAAADQQQWPNLS